MRGGRVPERGARRYGEIGTADDPDEELGEVPPLPRGSGGTSFVVHADVAAQQTAEAPITEPRALARQLSQPRSEPSFELRTAAAIPQRRPRLFEGPARPTLAQAELPSHELDRRASLDASGGPFLFGEFGISDCMYAPMLARFRTYGIALPDHAARYAEARGRRPVCLP